MDVLNLYMYVLKRDHVNMFMFKCNLTMFNFENTPCLRFEHDRVPCLSMSKDSLDGLVNTPQGYI
jgi:hypothetical protein